MGRVFVNGEGVVNRSSHGSGKPRRRVKPAVKARIPKPNPVPRNNGNGPRRGGTKDPRVPMGRPAKTRVVAKRRATVAESKALAAAKVDTRVDRGASKGGYNIQPRTAQQRAKDATEFKRARAQSEAVKAGRKNPASLIETLDEIGRTIRIARETNHR